MSFQEFQKERSKAEDRAEARELARKVLAKLDDEAVVELAELPDELMAQLLRDEIAAEARRRRERRA